jgi:hypothetical protein
MHVAVSAAAHTEFEIDRRLTQAPLQSVGAEASPE